MNLPTFFLVLLAIGQVATKPTAKFTCPKNFPCNCYRDSDPDRYQLHCSTNLTSQSAFDLSVQPGSLVHITCKNSPGWADFLHGASLAVGPVHMVVLSGCMAPEHEGMRQLEISGVRELKIEDLRGGLTAEKLAIFPQVEDLELVGSRIGNASAGFFKAMPNLSKLNLMSTKIQIPPGFFNGASSVRALELGDNDLKDLYPGIFDGLENIELLNVWRNGLSELHPQSFRNLSTLVSLDLHSNNLTRLAEDIFKDLPNLKVVNLGMNNFTSLPAGLFNNSQLLQTVKLFSNQGNLTELPARMLANLENLKSVLLTRIGLTSVPEDLLWRSTNVAELKMGRNFLSTLPEDFLRDAKELVTLELFFNDLKALPAGLFANSKKLVTIDLSRNHLTSISEELFNGLSSLKELNMQHNDLAFIHPDAFQSLGNLKIARFAYNQITSETNSYDFFGLVSPFYNCQALERLDLSHNNITAMFSDWVINHIKLRKLDLSYNRIEYLEAGDLQFISNAIAVDLSHNQIQSVNLDRLEMMAADQKSKQRVTVDLEHNSIQCDCEAYSLLRYLNREMNQSALDYVQLRADGLVCQGPEYMQGVALAELRASELKCLVESSGELAGDPCAPGAQCDCWHRPSDHALILDCSNRNLTVAPTWIDARMMAAVDVDLSGNQLRRAPTMGNKGYRVVRSLNLAGNKIDSLDESLITPNLKVLNLENNELRMVEPTVFEKILNLSVITTLTLSGNPWQCDCESVELFQFSQKYFKHMPDIGNATCADTQVSLQSMSLEGFCPHSISHVLVPCVALALLGLVFGSLVALYYMYQQPIKVWLYSKNLCAWLFTEHELDRDKQYDAFVSYSHRDQEFVVRELVAQLEAGPKPYRLCIHERDWIAGDWIPNQIMRSVEQSRRTIVVLSPSFMESIWGKLEFQAAHKKALSEKCARVIVVLYGDIKPNDIVDPDLKAYLQTNTYVKWGDPWFWQKLRYAMPHTLPRPGNRPTAV